MFFGAPAKTPFDPFRCPCRMGSFWVECKIMELGKNELNYGRKKTNIEFVKTIKRYGSALSDAGGGEF